MRGIMSFGIVLIAAYSIFPADSYAQTAATVSQPALRIAMLIPANAFRDEEFQLPFKYLSEHATVTVASTKLGVITGMMGYKATADTLIKDVNVDTLDALVLIGGPGARQYWWDPVAHNLVRETAAKKKVLAAICLSPVTLAYAGVLKGKRATVWVSERGRLSEKGANYTGEDVTIDGLIITASGPKAAQQFGEEILKLVLETKAAQEKLKAQEAPEAEAPETTPDTEGTPKQAGCNRGTRQSK